MTKTLFKRLSSAAFKGEPATEILTELRSRARSMGKGYDQKDIRLLDAFANSLIIDGGVVDPTTAGLLERLSVCIKEKSPISEIARIDVLEAIAKTRPKASSTTLSKEATACAPKIDLSIKTVTFEPIGRNVFEIIFCHDSNRAAASSSQETYRQIIQSIGYRCSSMETLRIDGVRHRVRVVLHGSVRASGATSMVVDAIKAIRSLPADSVPQDAKEALKQQFIKSLVPTALNGVDAYSLRFFLDLACANNAIGIVQASLEDDDRTLNVFVGMKEQPSLVSSLENLVELYLSPAYSVLESSTNGASTKIRLHQTEGFIDESKSDLLKLSLDELVDMVEI